MTTITNIIRIDIDVNPESGKIVNHDLMAEIAARAFDWRLFVYDPDDDDGQSGIIEQTRIRLNGMLIDIADATHVPVDDIIITTDCIDASDFVFAIEYESAYVGTVSTYTGVVMISYTIMDEYSHE
jgi:hypothetical protein